MTLGLVSSKISLVRVSLHYIRVLVSPVLLTLEQDILRSGEKAVHPLQTTRKEFALHTPIATRTKVSQAFTASCVEINAISPLSEGLGQPHTSASMPSLLR